MHLMICAVFYMRWISRTTAENQREVNAEPIRRRRCQRNGRIGDGARAVV